MCFQDSGGCVALPCLTPDTPAACPALANPSPRALAILAMPRPVFLDSALTISPANGNLPCFWNECDARFVNAFLMIFCLKGVSKTDGNSMVRSDPLLYISMTFAFITIKQQPRELLVLLLFFGFL